MPPSACEHHSDLDAPSSRWVPTLQIKRSEAWWTFICPAGHTHLVARSMGNSGTCLRCWRSVRYVDDPAHLAMLRLGGPDVLLLALYDQHQGEW